MSQLVRLATIHPALAHFTIGGLPFLVVAYALALRRRSPEWALAGDTALLLTALFTVGTGGFGLVSNAIVPWPGGLERWRLVHLAGGLATTLGLALLAGWRAWQRRQVMAPSPRLLAALLAVAAIAAGTGWVGGEVLVFHAGMAVRAAGDGALAPPVVDSTAPPRDFVDAMRGVRAAWGSIEARLASMLVQRPRDRDFARIAVDAARLQQLATAMADAPGGDTQRRELVAMMARTLAGDGADIAAAAAHKDLQSLARAVGEASAHCADCHQQLRWR
jgi:uncharacterized membrane protein